MKSSFVIHVCYTYMYVLVHVGIALGYEEYGNRAKQCIKYSVNETMPDIYGADRFCIVENGERFCREWSCNYRCTDFKKKWDGKCHACNDTCTDGGRIYKLKEQFACVDNANICVCLPRNTILKTRRAQTVSALCDAPSFKVRRG